MSNESITVTEQTMENGNMAAAEEKRGVSGENKIVPITPAAPAAPAPEADAMSAAFVPASETSAVQGTPSETSAAARETTPVSDTAKVLQNTPAEEAVPAAEAAPARENISAAAAPVQETSDETPKKDVHTRQTSESRAKSYREEPDDFDFYEDERPKKSFFHFRSVNEEESRDKLILSRIKDEDLMEYLALEQRRLEFLQQSKELKQKRILTAFQLLISLAAIVAITYLLKDNPTILISILYIVGIIAALNIWKNPHGKEKDRWRR